MKIMKPVENIVFVLIGGQGVGKTTLYNKLCNQNYPCGFSEESLTRGLYKHNACYGNIPFELIDTPASDSEMEPMKHAILIKEALTVQPINIIFVLVEFKCRVQSATDQFESIYSPLQKYKHKIIVLISKFDQCEVNVNDQEKIKQSYSNKFLQKFDIKNIIFISKNDDASRISNMMTDYLSQSQFKGEKLEYTEQDFLNGFEFREATHQQRQAYEKNKEKINLIIKDYQQIILQNKNDPDKDGIIFSAITQCKIDLNKIADDFLKEFRQQMNELQYYTQYVRLQKLNLQKYEELRKQGFSLLNYDPSDPNDPKNKFKRCPNPECRILWVKVEGCDGTTTCGNRPSLKNDLQEGSYCLYIFKKIGSFFQLEKKKIVNQPIKNKVINTKVLEPKSKGVGCGANMNWGQLPQISDQELDELQKVVDIKNIIDNIIKDDNYQKNRYNYEQTIIKGFNDERNNTNQNFYKTNNQYSYNDITYSNQQDYYQQTTTNSNYYQQTITKQQQNYQPNIRNNIQHEYYPSNKKIPINQVQTTNEQYKNDYGQVQQYHQYENQKQYQTNNQSNYSQQAIQIKELFPQIDTKTIIQKLIIHQGITDQVITELLAE